MEKMIRWGIVGAGNIANKFAEAMNHVSGACLSAVASRTEQTGRAFAEKHHIEHLFVGYEEMAKSDMVDAVYIATPHPFHKPCAELFLKAKKHVLCEKPVCVNADQAKELKACAEENGVFLMEAMWTWFLPAIQEAVAVAKSGEIGVIRGVSADFCYSTTPEAEPKIYQNDMAGGSLLDVGVYGLTFAAVVLGEHPEHMVAVSDVTGGVDCQTNVLLKYANGVTAHVSSAINVRKPETAYIYGTKGYIEVPRFYGAQELIVHADAGKRHISKPSIGDGFEEEIIEACECIRAGKMQSDILPMSESIRIMQQMDEIRKQIHLAYPFDA